MVRGAKARGVVSGDLEARRCERQRASLFMSLRGADARGLAGRGSAPGLWGAAAGERALRRLLAGWQRA